MIVRCTRKLLRELSIRTEDLESGHEFRGLFGDWHANLLRIDQRKCLLLTDTGTLFTFLVPAVLRRDLLDFGRLLTALAVSKATSFSNRSCSLLIRLTLFSATSQGREVRSEVYWLSNSGE